MIAKIEAGRLDPTYSKVNKIEQAIDRLSHMEKVKIQDIMVKKIISVDINDKILDIIKLMDVHSISQVPVIDQKERVIGLISESSILKKEDKIGKDTLVKQVMDEAPPIVSQETDIDVIKKLLPYYNLVLIKKQGKLVGLITRSDLIKH